MFQPNNFQINEQIYKNEDNQQQLIRFLTANICMISPIGNIKRQDFVGQISVTLLIVMTYLYKGFDINNSIFAHACVIFNLFGFVTVTMQIKKRFFFFQVLPIFYFLMYAEYNYFIEGQLIWNIMSCFSVIFVMIPWMSVLVAALMIVFLPKQYHEQHKQKRVELLVSKFTNYDLICIQESTILLGNTYYQDQIIKKAKELGFHYVAHSGRFPTFPSILCNTGLLVLSRYPIKQIEAVPFKFQPWYQWDLYHKGALYCQVQVAENKFFHLINLHTSISDKIIQDVIFFYNKNKNSDQNIAGLYQLQQMYDFLQDQVEKAALLNRKITQKIIVAGDFNQQPCSQEYKFIQEKLQKINVHDVHLMEGTRQATIGQVNILGEPIERLMTAKSDQKISQTLDYIFSNIKTIETGYDALKNEDEESKEIFQQVSDHWGVNAVFSI